MSDPIIPPSALACLPWIDPGLLDGGFPRHAVGNAAAPTTERRARPVQVVTPSATLRELLTRCLHALDLAVSDTPDLVLLDLAAPDALTHCQTLREQHPDLPIVALIHLAADFWPAWEAGANAVLCIPFDVLELHATIHILLGENDA